jgi:hypothetical protein
MDKTYSEGLKERFGIDTDKLSQAEADKLVVLLSGHYKMMVIQYGYVDILERIKERYITDDPQAAEELADDVLASHHWSDERVEASQWFYDDPFHGYETVCRPVHKVAGDQGIEIES